MGIYWRVEHIDEITFKLCYNQIIETADDIYHKSAMRFKQNTGIKPRQEGMIAWQNDIQ